MKLKSLTLIENTVENVWPKFNKDLFVQLKPPFVNLVVERFDGCRQDDLFNLQVSIFGKLIHWNGKITKHYISEKECYFIDEGILLPWPLIKWTHKHRIIKSGFDKCFISDEVEFITHNMFLDFMMYINFRIMFMLRKPIYKKVLGRNI